VFSGLVAPVHPKAMPDELRTILDFLRKGDVLMVTRIDRLARSIGDLRDIVRAVKARGASLKATEQPIDTSTAAGKACFPTNFSLPGGDDWRTRNAIEDDADTTCRHERSTECT
jgi:hypothetical protein